LQRPGKQRVEEGANRGIAEDIGNAHLAEAKRLHGEKSLQQGMRLCRRPSFDALVGADCLEFPDLRAVFLALSLAAGAAKETVEPALEIGRQRQVGAWKIRQAGQRIRQAVQFWR